MFLNCHTYYSFHYGTLSVEALVKEAAAKNIQALAVTDINNTSAALDFVRAAQKQKIRPVLGVEFRNEQELLYIALAQNNDGFCEINQYLSHYLVSVEPIPPIAPHFDNAFVIYPFAAVPVTELRPNELIGVAPSQTFQYATRKQFPAHKYVALNTITFAPVKRHYYLHKVLRAIDLNTIYTKLTNHDVAHPSEYFQSADELEKVFHLAPELLGRAGDLIQRCAVEFEFKTPKNRVTFTASRKEDIALLKKITWSGFKKRYSKDDAIARKRVQKELDVIIQLDFAQYFLITWDIICFAQDSGFRHVGRGSGANSIVAYCTYITDVDPIELDLYFERFINPHRSSPPDFDIDFSWDQRDAVIEYVLAKYGADHTALLATYSTFKRKSAVRETAKVFGLPKHEVDRLIAHPDHELNDNRIAKKIKQYATLLEGFPNHLGIHVGGIIISEKPIYHYTAKQMMPKGFPITQWDMYVAEDIGFYKFDILSQRGLGHIKEAVELIYKNQGVQVDIHDRNRIKHDQRIKDNLLSGNTIGCFYIESPAMRALLKKLQCDNYNSLVAASSIIRPGVAQSGMMKEYIYRFHHPDGFQHLHPVMEEQMGDTFGIMIYQEDVIKVAHHFGGIDLADADVLRRGMSGKYRSREEMQRIVDTFFRNCAARGYPEHIVAEVWRQIESFAGYSFSKAHSASYAVESLQSLFLKTYYPLEFMVAVINNFGGFYRTEYYVHEARNAGGTIHPPCVNQSNNLTTIDGVNIVLGFVHVQQLESKLVDGLLAERTQNGPFCNLFDFSQRISIGIEQLSILIRVEAFRFTGLPKKELLWQAHFLLGVDWNERRLPSLFQLNTKPLELPPLTHNPYDDIMDQLDLLHFSLQSPFGLLEEPITESVDTSQLMQLVGQTISLVGYYVQARPVRTVRKEKMSFGCFVDLYGNFFDTVHFPACLEKHPFDGRACYFLTGKVVEDFGFATIEINFMKRLEMKSREAYAVEQFLLQTIAASINEPEQFLLQENSVKPSL